MRGCRRGQQRRRRHNGRLRHVDRRCHPRRNRSVARRRPGRHRRASPSRRRRTPRRTAPSSARARPRTRCRPRRPVVRPSAWRPASTSSSRCRSAANAINVRYSIPDAPTGGGITSPLKVTVNGGGTQHHVADVAVRVALQRVPVLERPATRVTSTSTGGVVECACVPSATTPVPTFPTPFRPNHFYDEQRLLLGKTYKAGDKIRLAVPGGAATTTVIDLLDSQLVGRAEDRPARGERARVRCRPVRRARLAPRVRQGDRVRAEVRTSRSTCRRAPTR